MTIKQINKALQARFPGQDIELVRGKGYFYFAGQLVELWPDTSVLVAHLQQLPLDRWVAEAVQRHEQCEAFFASRKPK